MSEDEEGDPDIGEIAQLLRQKQFYEATKRYSELSGLNYIDSKLAIDRLAHKHGLAPRSGCLSYFMVLVVSVGGAAWWVVSWL